MKFSRIVLVPLVFSIVVICHPHLGFTEDYKTVKDFHKSNHQFNQYLKEKYQHVRDTDLRIEQTPYGMKGDLVIRGNIMPAKIDVDSLSRETDRHKRAKAIGQAFIEEEAELLGLDNQHDVREYDISTEKGFGGDYTYIAYRRYINGLWLDTYDMRITIGPDEKIFNLHSNIVPAPPELYKAVKEKTLEKEDIIKITNEDMKKYNHSFQDVSETIFKVATPEPPYVVWKVNTVWYYRINAFTGEIISKIDSINREWRPSESMGSDQLQDNTQPPMPPPVLPQK